MLLRHAGRGGETGAAIARGLGPQIALFAQPVAHLGTRVARREPDGDIEPGLARRREGPGHHDAIESEGVAVADLGGESVLDGAEPGCVEEDGERRRGGGPRRAQLRTSAWKRDRRSRVTGPGLPVPMTRPSTWRIAITSLAVPVKNASSAVYTS
jgi:hypothetical protein